MSSLESPSQDAALVLQTVQTAMSEYFTLLCRMPHMKNYICKPSPQQGWPELDTETLKAFGKSDEAVDFLRHLPCLVGESPVPAPITPYSNGISFCDGKTWESWRNDICITPAHVVLIGLPPLRHLRYLLLDTKVGSITEYAPMGGTELLPYEEYEALPDADKWMANSTLPAQAYFARECQRLKRLVYIPVPTTRGDTEYYFRANNAAEDADLLAVDDEEYDSDRDMDPDYNEQDHDTDEDDSESGDDGDVANPQQRLEDLQLGAGGSNDSHDADGDEEMSVPSEELDALISDSLRDCPGETVGHQLGTWKPPVLAEGVSRVYEIYKQNGWPHAKFNKEKCRAELLQFIEEVEAERRKKTESANKNNDPDFRQRMIEQRKRIEEQRSKESASNA